MLRPNHRTLILFHLAILILSLPLLPAGQRNIGSVSGLVTDTNGYPIRDALIISSGGKLNGWAFSESDGSFRVSEVGQFIAFRAVGYKSQLVRLPVSSDAIRVQLSRADESVRTLQACPRAQKKSSWIGDGLRVQVSGGYDGPVYGDHDSHWYLKRGGDRLHIVDGLFWHNGLPLEDDLLAIENLSLRTWVFGEIVGLDFSGRTRSGKYWRWIGGPAATAVSYETKSRSTAEYFDKVIATLCHAQR